MSSSTKGWLVQKQNDSFFLFSPEDQRFCQSLPKQITAKLGPYLLREIQIKPRSQTNKEFMLPARLLRTKDGTFRIGPFVAILTGDGGIPFKGNHQNFMDIIRTGYRMAIPVFVTTPKGLKYKDNLVKGYLLQRRKKGIHWKEAILPFPDVIYNRIPTRKLEQSFAVQEAFQRIHEKNIPIFNPNFFDKWTITSYLQKNPSLSKFLPDTQKWEGTSSLLNMGKKHPTLLLKPVDGKAGIGMMKIVKKSEGFHLIYQNMHTKRKYFRPTIASLFQLIQALSKKKAYLVQQCIPLATYEGRPFDVRMLFQKDITGKWQLTGAGIRVAGEKAITTHVPMGGRIENFQQVLHRVFPQGSDSIQKQLKTTGIQIVEYIEKCTGKNHGEMSMDIGIDQKGNLWFFEANAKPMKFDEPEIRKLSLRRLLEYSLYLSSFIEKVEEKSK